MNYFLHFDKVMMRQLGNRHEIQKIMSKPKEWRKKHETGRIKVIMSRKSCAGRPRAGGLARVCMIDILFLSSSPSPCDARDWITWWISGLAPPPRLLPRKLKFGYHSKADSLRSLHAREVSLSVKRCEDVSKLRLLADSWELPTRDRIPKRSGLSSGLFLKSCRDFLRF